MANQATFQHESVNSGTAVKLYNYEITYGWRNLVKITPAPFAYDITEANYLGFENPVITISGSIPIEDIPSPNTGSNAILTQDYLIDFAIACKTQPITLTISAGDTNVVYLKGRPSGGYSVGGSLTNSINIIILDFNVKFSSRETKEGSVWNYSITCRETI